ncbi:hypothetical protein P154DRAFT_524339 [Amniculicola lignicola CBS 123094]|uniref:MARVEL domain-containing protein n=1 Tax=Amniculicola lignicola CBS 123094 TaxID=1392246 RepID=A0A6A5W7W4_9PLEO|nr:hypothetical protein P154DRAFT_524339 [Amniculicola lignicola CBS 123094]
MYMLKGGVVPVPRWILIFRMFQLFFAILVLGLTAYCLSVYDGGPLRPPLIATIVIACLTLVPILLLTTPLHLAQRKIYDPRVALLLDGFAALYWLAAFSALASYQHIFRHYGSESSRVVFGFGNCYLCRKVWRTGLAATVFSAVEFLLFLLTSLAFIYYYHCHLADIRAPGVSSHGTDQSGTRAAAAEATTIGAEHHQMTPNPQHNHNTGAEAGADGAGYDGQGQTPSNIPYPPTSPRQPHSGAYGGYENGANSGYGAAPNQL